MHLYLYSLLHKLVKPVFGVDLATGVPGRILEGRMNLAQYAFAGVYVASLALVFVIYGRNKRLPQYLLPLLTISKRLHSIYVLRMFNDCLAMLFFYAAVVLYTSPEGGRLASALKGAGVGKRGRWAIGTGVFSLALGTKMSLLLPLPGLLYLLFVYHSPLTCLAHSLLLLTTQLALALPFSRPTPAALSALISSPSLWTLLPALAPLRTYLTQAFSLSRSFLYEFTQNWRWLQDEDLFLSRDFANLLLLAQAAGLCLFAVRWAEDEGGVESLLARAWRSPGKRPARREATPERIATILFTSNLVGVLCARSLHPQFYAWFAWQGVWVTFGSGIYEGMQNMLFLSLLEFAFHTYPSTVHSSLGFCIGLLAILAGVYYGRPCGEPKEEQRWEVGREAKGRKEE
ncbi:dolichyl-P-Man:Man(5)GlcNAc(2)-PP-dolichol alpha-1,3-mannosyltransferase [Rhodosporidiobolus nylandii]